MKAKNERKRIFIGDQINDCKDMSSLFFILPFQKVQNLHREKYKMKKFRIFFFVFPKGYLVNFDTQHQIWDYIFGKDVFQVSFRSFL